jgi:hypothetical protein
MAMSRILTGFLFLSALSGSALAVDGGTVWHHHGLPSCDAPSVIATIPERFAYQDANLIGSGIAITGIDRIHEHAVKAGPGLVDRRYCGATAWLSNGRQSEVVYIIEGPKLGFASIGWHVESCLPAYDPYRVYDAWCRSIRP